MSGTKVIFSEETKNVEICLLNFKIDKLKTENAELVKRVSGLEGYIEHILPTNKPSIVRVKEEGNAFYQKCFKENVERIQQLEAALRDRPSMDSLYYSQDLVIAYIDWQEKHKQLLESIKKKGE